MNKNNCDIYEIFNGEPKEPFTLNMQLQNSKNNLTTKEIFNEIKGLYCKGLIIQKGGKIQPNVNKLKITEVKENHLNRMKLHMLSLGIEVKNRVYSDGIKNYLFKELLHDIQHIEGIEIMVTTDWKQDLIKGISISFEKNVKKNSILQFEKYIRKHYEANYFLKILEPKHLKEYAVIIKISENNYHVTSFDFAKHDDDFRKKIIAQMKVNN